jgi:hypothetical protein
LPPLDFPPAKRPKFLQLSDQDPQPAFDRDDPRYRTALVAQEKSNKKLLSYEPETYSSTQLSWSSRHSGEEAEIGTSSIHREVFWEQRTPTSIIQNDCRIERTEPFQETAPPVLQDYVNGSSPVPYAVSITSRTSYRSQDQGNCQEMLGDSSCEGEEGVSEVVCYGMVSPSVKSPRKDHVNISQLMDILVESASFFDCRDDCVLSWSGETSLRDRATGQEILQLPQRMCQVLTTLSQNANVEAQFLLQPDENGGLSMSERSSNEKEPQHSSKLCVILYGPADIATEVGNWLDQCQLYLQLPQECDRNVRYLNPHCLSFGDDNQTMTFDLKNSSDLNTQAKDLFADVLMELDCEEPFDESPQPALISTPLHRHQKQALTFMLGREKGWDLTGSRRDLWRSYVDSRGTARYQNILSGRCQIQPPCPFNGGILGKTLLTKIF